VEEAKRDKKLKEYNAKAEEIKRRLQEKFYGTTGAHERHTAEYDSYGGPNGYQNAIDYTNELEIQEKIRKHEEKMSKAHYNRLKRLEEQRITLQYQSEQH
jgi:hypothetical protein